MFFVGFEGLSQNQSNINFQGLARDQFGNVGKNKKIFIQTAILKGSENGEMIYQEEFTSKTDGEGIFSIQIGRGILISEKVTQGIQGIKKNKTIDYLKSINWANDNYYLNVKISLEPKENSLNYDYVANLKDMGTSLLGSVPHAIIASSVEGFETKLNVTDTTQMLSNYVPTHIMKKHVETKITEAISGVPEASSTILGKIKLAGDLTGTALVPRIAYNAITTSNIRSEAVTSDKIFTLEGGKIRGDINGKAGSADRLAYPRRINGVLFDGTNDISIGFNGVASSASKLATARTINGIAFDGTANITIPTGGSGSTNAAALTGNTLATGITASSLTSVGNLTAGGVPYSLLTGSVPLWNQNTTGNAASATKLATARTINGIAFDGTANITIPTGGSGSTDAAALTGNTLASGITASSLTSVGNLTAGGVPYSLLTGSVPLWNQNTTGNAASATKLATARTINGIAFDGTANITIPTAGSGSTDAATLTGNTLASGITGSSLTSVGTITTGVWNASTIPLSNGGTGATTAAGARTALDAQQNITAGTTSQYFRGDKTFVTLNTDVVPEGSSNKYFTETRVLNTPLAGMANTPGIITSTEPIITGINKVIGNQLINSSTGIYSFAGITLVNTSTINVGAAKGYIIDNTTDPTLPTITSINYAGGTGLTTPHLATSTISYVYLDINGTIQFSATELTPAQRRSNLLLGKLGHPSGAILSIYNQPDLMISPLEQLRDIWTPIRLINDGIITSANGANLSFNLTAGTLYGLGIGYSSNVNTPSSINFDARTPVTFQYRTQNGGGAQTDITVLDPTRYDNLGTITTVSNNANATNQRIFLLQNGKIRVQYGEQVYATLAAAISGAQTETFKTYAGIKDYGILLGILSVTKNCTSLLDNTRAQFLSITKFGETTGAASGIVTANLQQTYNNGSAILTDATNGAVDIRQGSGADTDNVFAIQNGAGLLTSTITGAGVGTFSTLSSAGGVNYGDKATKVHYGKVLANGTLTAATESGISSVTRNAAGDYTITLSTAFVNNPIVTCTLNTAIGFITANATSTTSIAVKTYNTSSVLTDADFNIIISGN